MWVSSVGDCGRGLLCGGASFMISPSSAACEVADSARARFAGVSVVVVYCDSVVSIVFLFCG